jgi:outer membrane protein OmpA-like peptidoglycan-associated protein
MEFKKVLIGAASALVLSAGVAQAGYDRDGWYFGLEAGVVNVADTAVAVTTSGGTRALDLDGGIAMLGTFGYALSDSNWRIEGELGNRFNDGPAIITSCAGLTVPVCSSNVPELTEWTYMVNAVYDFKFSSERFGLSLGAGVGMDNARLEFVGVTPAPGVDDSDWKFAAQGIVGATYRLSQHWDVMANYRYLFVNEPELYQTAEVEMTKHTFTIGVRYGYNEPPAEAPVVVPPPPPPAAPKQFIVFFGYNKCNITAEADAVLSEAAAAAKSSGSASVRIVGHTDTSGSAAYNQKLSECRANAAKTNLAGKGVAEGSISTSGNGEAELMVQTGDGVKEPQNRRATVDLQ